MQAMPPSIEATMALALSSAETAVLRATDTKTISRSATSAAAMSNDSVSLNHLISIKQKKGAKTHNCQNGGRTCSARSRCST
jgi:hypothetical protein